MPFDPTMLPDIQASLPGEDPKYAYTLETLRFEGKTIGAPLLGLSANLAIATGRGWQRRLLASEVTGNPRQMCQLFKTPIPYPGAIESSDEGTSAVELAVLRNYHRMFEDVAEFQRVVLTPLPYDPSDARPRLAKNASLLLVRAAIREGAMARFVALKRDFFIEEVGKDGWQLVFAGRVISESRPQSTIVQGWALPTPTTLIQTMARMAQNGTYREFLAPCITEESQLLYSLISDDA
jgi:hypothetical protein